MTATAYDEKDYLWQVPSGTLLPGFVQTHPDGAFQIGDGWSLRFPNDTHVQVPVLFESQAQLYTCQESWKTLKGIVNFCPRDNRSHVANDHLIWFPRDMAVGLYLGRLFRWDVTWFYVNFLTKDGLNVWLRQRVSLT